MELSPYSLLYIMRTTLVVPYPKKATTFDGGGKSKIVAMQPGLVSTNVVKTQLMLMECLRQ